MMKIAIVDDEEQYRIDLEKHLASFFRSVGGAYQCVFFSDAIDLQSNYDFSFDVIFMDIDMKHSNGMESAKHLRKIDPHVVLIFETHLAQYAVEGYLVDAIGYLVKPVEYYSLSLVMTKALAALQKARRTQKIIVMDGKQKTVIDSAEIHYIEVLNHMLIYHTDSGERKDWNSLNQREKELAPFSFFRCHRCFLINLNDVTGINSSTDEVILGDTRLPISRGKKAAFMDAMMEHYAMNGGRVI